MALIIGGYRSFHYKNKFHYKNMDQWIHGSKIFCWSCCWCRCFCCCMSEFFLFMLSFNPGNFVFSKNFGWGQRVFAGGAKPPQTPPPKRSSAAFDRGGQTGPPRSNAFFFGTVDDTGAADDHPTSTPTSTWTSTSKSRDYLSPGLPTGPIHHF